MEVAVTTKDKQELAEALEKVEKAFEGGCGFKAGEHHSYQGAFKEIREKWLPKFEIDGAVFIFHCVPRVLGGAEFEIEVAGLRIKVFDVTFDTFQGFQSVGRCWPYCSQEILRPAFSVLRSVKKKES